MGYTAKLTRGAYSIDLNDTPYNLMEGFVPPTTSYSYNMAGGTSANRTGGSSLVGKRANNQSFTFAVRILGASAGETDGSKRRISQFLKGAEGATDKTYFEWKADNNYDYEPMWGQFGANLRCEIVTGDVYNSPLYTVYNIREKAQVVMVDLMIKPFATGLRQRVGTAKGGICEDWIGTEDGQSRGVQIPEASGSGGNFHKNPIFGHSTYNTSWVDDANVTDTENNDAEFLLFGTSSVKLWASANDQYTELITQTAHDYTLSYYVKKPDGSAVTTADVDVHYDGSDETTTYTSVGNGWYRISATITGDGTANKTGITVKADKVLYMDGALCERIAYVTPFYYGDMLDCAWGGTAHNSVSTRAAAYLRFPGDEVISQELTIRIAWKAEYASGDIAANKYILHDSNGKITFYYHNASNVWIFNDGTGFATIADTYSANEVFVFHLTLSPNGINIYIDGALADNTAAYVPLVTPSWLYFGSKNDGTGQIGGTFLGFATFDREMSATEIEADYDEITEWVEQDSTGRRLEAIPWLWTIGGDNVCDKYIDSTHSYYAIAGGIGGSAPADTYFEFYNAASEPLLLNLNDYKHYTGDIAGGLNDLFVDYDGTVVGGAYGGEVKRDTTALTWQIWTTTKVIDIDYDHDAYLGKYIYMYIYIAYAGSDTIDCRLYQDMGGTITYYSDSQAMNVDAVLRPYLVGPIQIIEPKKATQYDWITEPEIGINIQHLSDNAGDNIDIDYSIAIVGDVAYIEAQQHGATDYIYVHGRDATEGTATVIRSFSPGITGDIIELKPDRINHLIVLGGDIDGSGGTHTTTVTINRIEVIPRYEII